MKEYNARNLKLFINGIEVECFNSIDMEKYIASYKHLIGCEVFDYDYGEVLVYNVEVTPVNMVINGMFPIDNFVKLYLDENTLGSYEEYMQLHYPEYEHVWKQQL